MVHGLVALVGGGGAVQPLVRKAAQAQQVCIGRLQQKGGFNKDKERPYAGVKQVRAFLPLAAFTRLQQRREIHGTRRCWRPACAPFGSCSPFAPTSRQSRSHQSSPAAQQHPPLMMSSIRTIWLNTSTLQRGRVAQRSAGGLASQATGSNRGCSTLCGSRQQPSGACNGPAPAAVSLI